MKARTLLTTTILLMTVLLCGVVSFLLITETSTEKMITTDAMKQYCYTDPATHFSLMVPGDWLCAFEEDRTTCRPHGITDGPYGLTIIIEETDAETTEAWLATQPKGGPHAEGFHPLVWLNSDGLMLLERYHIDERDTDGTPVYAKNLLGVQVHAGSLYQLRFRSWARAGDVSTLSAPFADLLNTFTPKPKEP